MENSTNSTDWNFYLDPQQSLNHQKNYSLRQSYTEYIETLQQIYIISHYDPVL